MQRLVLDTNIFVAAGFNPRSASARVLRGIEDRQFALVWNESTRRETERIVGRIPCLAWSRVAGLFRADCKHDAPVHPDAFAQVEDPDDRKFAALAADSGATLLTNDQHLLVHKHTAAFDVTTPAEFLRARDGAR